MTASQNPDTIVPHTMACTRSLRHSDSPHQFRRTFTNKPIGRLFNPFSHIIWLHIWPFFTYTKWAASFDTNSRFHYVFCVAFTGVLHFCCDFFFVRLDILEQVFLFIWWTATTRFDACLQKKICYIFSVLPGLLQNRWLCVCGRQHRQDRHKSRFRGFDGCHGRLVLVAAIYMENKYILRAFAS